MRQNETQKLMNFNLKWHKLNRKNSHCQCLYFHWPTHFQVALDKLEVVKTLCIFPADMKGILLHMWLQ